MPVARGMNACMTTQPMKPSRRYPVIAVDREAARAASEQAGTRFDLGGQGLGAVGRLAAARPSLKLRVWARELTTVDGEGRQRGVMHLYLVTPRGGGNIGSALCDELTKLWGPGAVSMEGSQQPTGDERPLWEVDASGARPCE